MEVCWIMSGFSVFYVAGLCLLPTRAIEETDMLPQLVSTEVINVMMAVYW